MGINFDERIIKPSEIKKLHKKHSKYFAGQKSLGYIKDANEEELRKSLKLGGELWNKIVEKAKQKYDGGDSILCYRTKQRLSDRHEVAAFSGENGYEGIRLMTMEMMIELLSTAYVDLCKSFDGANKNAYIMTGEGRLLLHKGEKFTSIAGLEDISIVAGPIVVCDNDVRINKFIEDMVAWQNEEPNERSLTLYRNQLMPFGKLYAGYFHCYVIGDTIFAESPHGFMQDGEYVYCFIFNDGECAEEIRKFFIEAEKESYASKFTDKYVSNDSQENLSKLYYAIDIRSERINKSALFRHYKNFSLRKEVQR